MIWQDHRAAAELTALIGVWLYLICPLVKLLAYCGWCRWGKAFLEAKPGLSALKDGLLRFAIGLAFGGAVYLIASALGPESLSRLYDRMGRNAVYVSVFVPIRWVEWWIMEHVMARNPGRLFHVTRGTLSWRAGGMLVSFATDVPLFALVSFLGAIA
jgi:hypothetical protein